MREYKSRESRLHLFAKPSFLTGVASIVDIFGLFNTYNTAKTDEEADYNAIYSDWLAVGDELQDAIDKYRYEVIR